MRKIWIAVLSILAMIIALVLSILIYWEVSSMQQKAQMIKKLSEKKVVRTIVAGGVKDDFQEKIQDNDFKEEEIVVNEEVETKITGFRNFVILGIDARDDSFDASTRTDTILIVSINNDNGAVRVVSVYRDTYMKIIDDDQNYYNRVNAAYNGGGARSALSTLNTNLDMNISDYVIVNFSGVSEIINMLGGIDISITEIEKDRINKISSDMVEGTDIEYSPLETFGEVHLTGLQATAFCRIRDAVFYDEEGNEYHYDFGRTAWQRAVILKLVEKVKSGGVKQLLVLAKQVLNMNTEEKTFIKTSFSYDEIMDLIPIMIDYNLSGNIGFPAELSTPTINGMDVVVAKDLAYNVSVLHEFLFEDSEYTPSETVCEISDYIAQYTGVKRE